MNGFLQRQRCISSGVWTIGAMFALTIGLLNASGARSLAAGNTTAVFATGNNDYGQLANGRMLTEPNLGVPLSARVANSDGCRAIAAGFWHSLAVSSDGSVYAWGRNLFGALGNGNTVDSPRIQLVPGLDSILAVAGGGWHSLALKSDGTVWAWGYNNAGQLGDGSRTNTDTPHAVPGLTGVVDIAAGEDHSVALKADGTVWTWGFNGYGALGNGTFNDSVRPAQIPGLSGVIRISSFAEHCLALMSDGTVWAWGLGSNGQIGDGSFSRATLSPVRVVNLSGVREISAGYSHSLALLGDGTLRAWGGNGYGTLGDGTNVGSAVPVVVHAISNVTHIGCGYFHSLAIDSSGRAWAWGSNSHGQLGDGTNIDANLPVPMAGIDGVSMVVGGDQHTLAIAIPDVDAPRSDSPVLGSNRSGQATASVTVQDTGSGLASIQVVSASNCTLSWPSFAPGSNAPLTVTATKTNQSLRSSFTFRVTDLAGNTTTVDPVVAQLTVAKGEAAETRTFRQVSASEHFLSIANGDPGLNRLTVSVNGRPLPPVVLSAGEQRSLDLGALMHAGANRITLVGRGPAGGTATVLISDNGASAPRPGRAGWEADWDE